MWPTAFLNEAQEENDVWERRGQEIQLVAQQVNRRCQSGSAESSRFDDISMLQQLSLFLPPDTEGSADILKELQSAVDLWLEATTEETKQRCNEALHALENTVEKVFERSYNADMDLKDFEGSIVEKWLEKKHASEHYAWQRDALTGMSFATRRALKHHDGQVARQRALEEAGKNTDVAAVRDDANSSESEEAAVQDDVVAVEQGPLKAETNTSDEGALGPTASSLLCAPDSEADPACVTVPCVGVSSSASFLEPRFCSRAEQASSSASLPMTPPLTSTHPQQADPAVITGNSFPNDFAAVQSFAAAQAIEADPAVISSFPNDFDAVPSFAAAQAIEAKDMQHALWAAADRDSDMDECDFAYLQKYHPGSAQHPHSCRPCHFQGGLCWKGMACTFCHLCPKPKRKSKHQRDVDKRRQERYLQIQHKLGEECREVLAAIDDGRRLMMSSSEDLKTRVKEAYESKDPVRIREVNQIANNLQKSVNAMW